MFVCVRFGLDGSGLVTSLPLVGKNVYKLTCFRVELDSTITPQVKSVSVLPSVKLRFVHVNCLPFSVYDSLSVLLYYIRRSKIC